MDRPKFRTKNRFVWDPLLDDMWINYTLGSSAFDIAKNLLTHFDCTNVNYRTRPTYYSITADTLSSADRQAQLMLKARAELSSRFSAVVKVTLFAGKPRLQIQIPRDVV